MVYLAVSSNYDAKQSSLWLGVMNMARYLVNGDSKERLELVTKLALHKTAPKGITTWKSCK